MQKPAEKIEAITRKRRMETPPEKQHTQKRNTDKNRKPEQGGDRKTNRATKQRANLNQQTNNDR